MNAKLCLLLPLLGLSAATSLYAETPAENVAAASKKLAETSYSWTTATVLPEGGNSRWGGGKTDGKTDGKILQVTTKMGERDFVTAKKGEKSVTKTENGWKTPEEMQAARGDGNSEGGGRGRGFGGFARMIKSPAEDVTELAKGAKELKAEGDAISGELTEEAAKARTSFGRGGPRREGSEAPPAPETKDLKVAVKFWLKDGAIAKYEVKTSGKRTWNGEERSMDSTRTTEIANVGTAKLDLPEEAVTKLNADAPAAEKKPEAAAETK